MQSAAGTSVCTVQIFVDTTTTEIRPVSHIMVSRGRWCKRTCAESLCLRVRASGQGEEHVCTPSCHTHSAALSAPCIADSLHSHIVCGASQQQPHMWALLVPVATLCPSTPAPTERNMHPQRTTQRRSQSHTQVSSLLRAPKAHIRGGVHPLRKQHRRWPCIRWLRMLRGACATVAVKRGCHPRRPPRRRLQMRPTTPCSSAAAAANAVCRSAP